MIVVFIVVLVVFGPHKLPELARGLGKIMAEFRKASMDFKSAFENEMRDMERQAREVERQKAAAAVTSQPATFATPANSETQSASSSLAPRSAETPATEAPVIIPVQEAVARSIEPIQATEPVADNSILPPHEHTIDAKASETVHHDHESSTK
jgi:sec-independent protein translocase protein TatB